MLIESFSGVRGIYGSDLTLDVAKKYGAAFYSCLKQKSGKEPLVVIGRDTRSHSAAIKDSIIFQFSEVIDVGVLPLPAVEHAVRHFQADGGIMVTASHNEPEWNGLKLLDDTGAILPSQAMQTIIEGAGKIKNIGSMHSANHQMIRLRRVEAISAYAGFLEQIIGKNSLEKIRALPEKALADPNGGAGIALREILDCLTITTLAIINESEGNFKRKIEPNRASLKYLKRHIHKHECIFGAGFDSDADRVGMLLPDGAFVDGNAVLGLVASHILKEHKGSTLTINDATSLSIKKIAEKYQCNVEEVEVGEANVLEGMRKFGSPLGGEGSNGGVIIPPSRCRDGILTLLFVLKIIAESGKSLPSLLGELPMHFSKTENIIFQTPPDKTAVRNSAKAYFAAKGYGIKETGDEHGGLKILIDDSSFLWLRFSRTESNTLRIIADSNNEAAAQSLLAEARKLLQSGKYHCKA